MKRSNGGCTDLNPANARPVCLLTWDGHQRAMETGRVVERVLDAGVEGAIAEVGVFNGGMAAYLQGILLARRATTNEPLRDLWLIDSFEGLPQPSRMTSGNAPASHHNQPDPVQRRWAGGLARSLNTVKRNLERFRVLQENVKFLPGFVNDTLSSWPSGRYGDLAVLRIDVDLYAPTYDTLHYLYPRLQRGGVVLLDDMVFDFSSSAVNDYRRVHSITTAILYLPGCVVPMAYWVKE